MAISILKPTIVGTRALLMGNNTSLNRHHELTRQWAAVKNKRKRTDAENDELERLQWLMTIYFSPKIGPMMPTANILAATIKGANLTKDGATVERFVTFIDTEVPLQYTGPRDLDTMWKSGSYSDFSPVKRGVIAVRPIFREWSVTFDVQLETDGIDERDFLRHLFTAGRLIGIGAWRKRFGRFRVELDGREVLQDGSLGEAFQEAA